MTQSMSFALNHITAPRRRFASFLDLAQDLGIRAVEARNDLPGVELADGTDPAALRRAAAARGIEILSINALQRFNQWDSDREREATQLAAEARASGAKALVLCPLNSREDRRSEEQRAQDLRTALAALMPVLENNGIIGLVEPLGFEESSLRTKRAAVDAIDAVGGGDRFRLVHDTFHHYLAGEKEFFPDRTGLVHISGVVDRGLGLAASRDEHRVLVDRDDRLGNIDQIKALRAGGYAGPLSFEPFARSVHELSDPIGALRDSISFIERKVETA